MQQQPLVFTSLIGKVAKPRKARTRKPQNDQQQQQQQQPHQPTIDSCYQSVNPLAIHEARRKRMSMELRDMCLQIAFDQLDPDATGKISQSVTDDIAHEIAYLIKFATTDEKRETERFLVAYGEEKLNEIETEERKAHKGAKNLHSGSESDECEENGEESDDSFVVPDDVGLSEEEDVSLHRGLTFVHDDDDNNEDVIAKPRAKRQLVTETRKRNTPRRRGSKQKPKKRKTIPVSEEEHEGDQTEPGEPQEELDHEGTNIYELD